MEAGLADGLQSSSSVRRYDLVKLSGSALGVANFDGNHLDQFVHKKMNVTGDSVFVNWRSVWLPRDLLRKAFPQLYNAQKRPHRVGIDRVGDEFEKSGWYRDLMAEDSPPFPVDPVGKILGFADPMKIKVVIASKYLLGNPMETDSDEESRVYLGHDPVTDELCVIKFGTGNEMDAELMHECAIYKRLSDVDQVPAVRYFGWEDDRSVMVLDRLGPSLELLFDYCDRTLTILDLVTLAVLLIELVKRLHDKNIIHGGLTPSHILVGEVGKRNTFYAISFGRAEVYDKTQSDEDIPSTEFEASGHANAYSSLRLHGDARPSRGDDLESVLIILIYLFHGRLPWHDEQEPENVVEKKMATPIEELCQGLPDEFARALHMVRALGINDEPNYSLLIGMCVDLAKRENVAPNWDFSWMVFQKKHFEISNEIRELLPAREPFPFLSAAELEILSKAREESRGRLAVTLRSLGKF